MRAVAARLAIAVCGRFPFRPLLSAMRSLNDVQLSTRELVRISAAVRGRRGCRLLVFGLGHDSAYWHALNRRGRTVFLEDDAEWLRKVLDRRPGLTALPVRYTTTLPEWRALLDQPDRLRLDWPDGVREGEWDVVLVDAPVGWIDAAPGRMQSIVAARQLAAPGADVFVHDCDRKVERVYCDRFLPAAGLVGKAERLRHYRIPAG